MNRSILNYIEDLLVNDDYHEKYFPIDESNTQEKFFIK
jgi:hypothetical protein